MLILQPRVWHGAAANWYTTLCYCTFQAPAVTNLSAEQFFLSKFAICLISILIHHLQVISFGKYIIDPNEILV